MRAEKCEYLGFIFPGKRIVWSPESLENFKYNIRRLTTRSWGISKKLRLQKLSSYPAAAGRLDELIRRRIRMCYMKQWRRTRTRIRNLLSLGASKSQAIPVGMSCKCQWRLARTYATQLGMNNAWLKDRVWFQYVNSVIAFYYPNG